ncbi:MAG: T9SS type A sorting domain-containing protein [Chitinophagaceae bacterium]
MKAVLDNRETHYSKTIVIHGSGEGDHPRLVTNPVNNGSIAITGTSDFQFTITDLNGRTVRSGTLQNGITSIPAQSLQKGMYLIRFTGHDGSTDTQKVMIQ